MNQTNLPVAVRLVFPAPKSGICEIASGTKVLHSIPFTNADSVCVEIPETLLQAVHPLMVRAAGFCCFVRDIQSDYPVLVEDRGAALPVEDPRSYAELVQTIRDRKLLSDHAQMNAAAEASFAEVAPFCRDRKFTPTYLGCGLDVRGFYLEIKSLRNGNGERDLQQWGVVFPRCHSLASCLNGAELRIQFNLGPGQHARPDITRRLADGCLPILHSIQKEKNIEYDLTAFATFETSMLSEENNCGTEHTIAYAFGSLGENLLSAEERAQKIAELDRSEEVVLRIRVKLRNVSATPAYAFFVGAEVSLISGKHVERVPFTSGMSLVTPDLCGAVTMLDGHPIRDEENSVLIWPGKDRILDIIIPNAPVSIDRAEKMAQADFDAHLAAARNYWQGFLDRAAKVEIPEAGVCDRFKAGLLHLLLATTGEKNGLLLANVGIPTHPSARKVIP